MTKKPWAILIAITLLVILLQAFIPLGNAVAWSSETRLTTHPKSDWAPSATQTSDGHIWVVWHAYRNGEADLYYSIYNGTSWSQAYQLTTDPNQDGTPSIAEINDGTIWVVWTSNRTGNFDIFYKTSSNRGLSWSNDIPLTTDAADDMAPSIAQISDGRIWVVWSSKRTGNDDVFYKVSSDKGATWTGDVQLTHDFDPDRAPSIMQTREGVIWVVWHSYRVGGSEIFYKTSSDNGLSWSSDARLTKDPDYDLNPSVMQARDGNVWVVWQSDRIAINGVPQDDIFYKIYDGSLWSNDTPLTANESDDMMPSVMQSKNLAIWVFWVSDRNDNYDIYYKTCGDFTLVHDVAVASVTPLFSTVYSGLPLNISVVLRNTGTVSESFNVTAYYSGTSIGKQAVIDLPPAYLYGASRTLNFAWKTIGVPHGYYTISAAAEPVPKEAYLGDNNLSDGTVHVKIPGDINGDDTINVYDAILLSRNFGFPASEFREGDINGDGAINVLDAIILALNWG